MSAPDPAEVVVWLRDDFGLAVDRLEPVVGGTDPDAAVWQARTVGGRLVAVKWTRRQTRTGLRLATSLQAEGIGGGARPVAARGGRAWSRRSDGRLSVAEWADGPDAATTGLDLGQWREYGALLAAVHDHRFPVPERRRGARRGIRRRRRRYRQRLVELDLLAAGSADSAVLRIWRSERARIERLIAGTRIPIEPDVPVVPCHGDPHLGNVVVDADGGLSLIDWDEAVVAPRELDLHLVEFSVLFAPATDAELRAFRQGYGPVEPDEHRLVRFACVRALEDLVATASAALSGPAESRADELAVFRGILSPSGSASLVEPRLVALLDGR